MIYRYSKSGKFVGCS
ncbi:MAG: hypothetical protein LBQ24_03720 [Candidatus Peribacteria bacterium]|nr:hypothetical protein [Candidatus Peribacteria bacterium]